MPVAHEMTFTFIQSLGWGYAQKTPYTLSNTLWMQSVVRGLGVQGLRVRGKKGSDPGTALTLLIKSAMLLGPVVER